MTEPTGNEHVNSLRRMDRRHFRRDQSHRESHSAPGAHDTLPIAAHPMASSLSAEVVNTQQALAEMIDHLKSAGEFAFDSEFIGERSYVPLLCLAQMATTSRVFVMDPMAKMDLREFWELLACPDVRKIVLAGQQDLEPVARNIGQGPANIMDAQLAAGFVHTDYPLSLGRLVEQFIGVPLGKGLTFSHWDNRPLSAIQVRYAGDDVRYLPAAWDAIAKRLAELGRTEWAREESAATLEDVALYRPAPGTIYLRVRGRDRLGRRQLAVLRELAILRDQAAKAENLPARTLLKDGVLLSMSRRPAKNLADLDGVKGLPRPVEAKYGQQILDATIKAMSLPDDQLPPPEPSETPAAKARVDEVWGRITTFCQERSIAPALVTSRKEVWRLCLAAAHGQASSNQHRLLRGWRKELLGDMLNGML